MLQVATDALSRYDQIIVTARIVLMFDGSSGQSQAIREAVPLFQQVYKIIRAKCPQWHEGNVQLMGVYLAITFLEYGLNSQTLGVDGQRCEGREGRRRRGMCVSSLSRFLSARIETPV